MRTKLTPDQIAEAKHLRFGRERMPWRKIGARLGCDYETVQRILDPGFSQERAAQKLSSRLLKDARAAARYRRSLRAPPDAIDDETDQRPMRVRMQEQDMKFQAALRTAILRDEEFCVEGVCRTPSTERPVFCIPYSEPYGVGSSAALCAEIGS